MGSRRGDAPQRGFYQGVGHRARQWQDNLKTSTAELIGVASSWERYEPVGVPGEDTRIVLPEADEVVRAYNASLARFIEREVTPRVDKLRSEIRMGGGPRPRQQARRPVCALRPAYRGADRVRACGPGRLRPGPDQPRQRRLPQKGLLGRPATYQEALGRAPNSKAALLGLARAQYELENFPEAGRAFAMVESLDPKLASGYAYLASRTEGAARASASASQRAGGGAWSEE